MSTEQALQILALATQNLAATRQQHQEILQALGVLEQMIKVSKAQLTAVPAANSKAE